VPYFDAKREVRSYGTRLVRLNVGLEKTTALVDDLDQALNRVASGRS
jgi:cystathionine beta-lyase/cystathionine gamma-synthase